MVLILQLPVLSQIDPCVILCHDTHSPHVWLVRETLCNMSTACRYNQKSDMWALGCVLYEMLTLRKVFDATVSKLFLQVLVQMIPNPRQRDEGQSTKCTLERLKPIPFCMQTILTEKTPLSAELTSLFRPFKGVPSSFLTYSGLLSSAFSSVSSAFCIICWT